MTDRSTITKGADNVKSQTTPKREPTSQIVGKPERWQLHTLALLQQRVQEAQADLSHAMRSFAPEPGCSLENGAWVRTERAD